MIPLLAAVHRHHHHRHCYHPHHLMEQQQSSHLLLQNQRPDISITSVEKKLVTSRHYAKSYFELSYIIFLLINKEPLSLL